MPQWCIHCLHAPISHCSGCSAPWGRVLGQPGQRLISALQWESYFSNSVLNSCLCQGPELEKASYLPEHTNAFISPFINDGPYSLECWDNSYSSKRIISSRRQVVYLISSGPPPSPDTALLDAAQPWPPSNSKKREEGWGGEDKRVSLNTQPFSVLR